MTAGLLANALLGHVYIVPLWYQTRAMSGSAAGYGLMLRQLLPPALLPATNSKLKRSLVVSNAAGNCCQKCRTVACNQRSPSPAAIQPPAWPSCRVSRPASVIA